MDLKNSETRIRAIRKINSTYKKVINQLLHDSLYYQPVLDALQADYKEQTTLVEQTYNIGNPAIKSTKDLERSLKRLEKRTRKDEMERTEVIDRNKGILKEHPRIVKELVRRDVRTFNLSLELIIHQLFSLISAFWLIVTTAIQDQ